MSGPRRSRSSDEKSSDSYPDVSETAEAPADRSDTAELSSKASSASMLSDKPVKRAGKRPGRKPSKIDVKARLERSRQSARECRARKKLRYQYLEELVLNREKAIFELRDELEVYRKWCHEVDEGEITDEMREKLLDTKTQVKQEPIEVTDTGQDRK